MKNRVTVRTLAEEANMELDDVLVSLWYAGMIELEDPKDFIPRNKINLAKRTLGIATKQDLISIKYWATRFDLSVDEFRTFAESLGIDIASGSRTLPKGAIKKLRQEAQKRHLATVVVDIPLEEIDKNKLIEPFSLPSIGHNWQTLVLNVDEVKGIHKCLVEDFKSTKDPIYPSGIRDEQLLSSAVHRQHTSFGTVNKYNTPELVTAALTHSLVNNHAFYNGNKRTALVSLLVMLEKNGLVLTCNEDDLFKFILIVAQHRLIPKGSTDIADREVAKIAEWICQYARKIETGDRTISWRRLDKILREYDCSLELAIGVGNRMNITRSKKKSGFLRSKKVRLTTQVYYAGMGTDADLSVIKKIRKDLSLDDKSGVDSNFFYQKESHTIDDFINRYRKTLGRLAKL